MADHATGAAEPLWLKNGPAYPFDLCFDFANNRVLLLATTDQALGSQRILGGIIGRGSRAQKAQYERIKDLTLEERLKADRELIEIPFERIIRLVLDKSWGRPPAILLETELAGDRNRTPNGTRYVRKHEFPLSSDRHLHKEQIDKIRQALPSSGLGPKFEDRIR